jgi:hypothetical protein
MQRLRDDQYGAVMVLTGFAMVILLLFAGLALDFGRTHLLRAQLQTALDAAALAGALEVIPMVEIQIPRWEWAAETCTDPVSGNEYDCSHWERTSPVRVSGTEWDLLLHNRGRELAGAQCRWPYRCDFGYDIVRRWQILPPETIPVAENTFHKNAAWPAGSSGVRVEGLRITVNPAKNEVTATATMRAPTSFLKLIRIRELRFTRSGSAVPVRR